jgi:hypothetical protein
MRLIAIIITTLICQTIMAQNTSLKFQTDDSYYYPSDLAFEVIDENGKTVLTEKDLEVNKPIILEGNYEVTIFTTWANGKDTFKVTDEALIALEQNEKWVNIQNKKSCCSEATSAENSWNVGKPKVVNTAFEVNNGQYDAIIEFENEIFFNFLNGEAKITEKGETLELIGNYVAKTSEGFFKMSYNPETKEYWYVFTDTYNKVVYK